MARITQLIKTDTGDLLYPITSIDAVFDSEGNSLAEKLENKEEITPIQIDDIQTLFNEVYE